MYSTLTTTTRRHNNHYSWLGGGGAEATAGGARPTPRPGGFAFTAPPLRFLCLRLPRRVALPIC